MSKVGVPMQRWVDDEGRDLFFGLGLSEERHIPRTVQTWYWDYNVGAKVWCCS